MAIVITKRQRHGIVATALAVLAVVVVTAGARGGGGERAEVSADGAGAAVVASELPIGPLDLFDGGATTFAAFEGTPLVINFWASWCPACVGELPEFQSVHETRGDEVTFLGIANADIKPAAERLARDVGLTYALVDDPAGALFRDFELIAMPSTLFVDADGRIVEVFAGQLDERALEKRIDALLEPS